MNEARIVTSSISTATIELRLSDASGLVKGTHAAIMARRRREADEFYAELTPAGCPDDEALVLRQALAGMLWSKQFYHYQTSPFSGKFHA